MAERDWQAEVRREHARGLMAGRILGVGPTAGPAEVQRAYRAASRACHPDLHPDDPGAAERFRILRLAFEYVMHGSGGEELDVFLAAPVPATEGGYQVDNVWGYWCWWRERFFHDT